MPPGPSQEQVTTRLPFEATNGCTYVFLFVEYVFLFSVSGAQNNAVIRHLYTSQSDHPDPSATPDAVRNSAATRPAPYLSLPG